MALAWGALLTLTACAGKAPSHTGPEASRPDAERMPFSADSAYAYVRAQVDMGPRVPGTDAHRACQQWLVGKFKAFGADTVIEQKTTVTAANGDRLPINNILARFNPSAERRLLVAAHYDTRPWADQDPDAARRAEPFDGANDGASGVAVALELARQLGLERGATGVDFLMVDAEDYGVSGGDDENSWCLGAQYWIEHQPYTIADRPEFGILLDMVGGRDARFHREYFSARYVGGPTSRIWAEAARQGLGEVFVDDVQGAVTDDHLYLFRGGIPTVDIIECAHPATGSFNPRWHTHSDNIDGIDPSTLGAVGSVVMGVIKKF